MTNCLVLIKTSNLLARLSAASVVFNTMLSVYAVSLGVRMCARVIYLNVSAPMNMNYLFSDFHLINFYF